MMNTVNGSSVGFAFQTAAEKVQAQRLDSLEATVGRMAVCVQQIADAVTVTSVAVEQTVAAPQTAAEKLGLAPPPTATSAPVMVELPKQEQDYAWPAPVAAKVSGISFEMEPSKATKKWVVFKKEFSEKKILRLHVPKEEFALLGNPETLKVTLS